MDKNSRLKFQNPSFPHSLPALSAREKFLIFLAASAIYKSQKIFYKNSASHHPTLMARLK